MNYKAIIFDLDGVICSTDQYHYHAWKIMADEIGVEFNETINNRLRGIGRMESLDIILESYRGKLSVEEKINYTEKKNDYYRQSLQKMSPEDLSQEVQDTLNIVKAKDIKVAIGSSSKNAKLILKQIGLEKFFDAISDGNNITHSKPNPEVFSKASDYLGIAPQLCLVVEDAKAGLEAAYAANMDCAAIGDATRYHLATYNLNSFSDLLLYL